jgi:acetoin utilization protein AcuB
MAQRIDQWMKHPVIVAKPRDTALHARELMEQHRVNQLPVLRGTDLVGIVTDRDLRDAFPSAFEPLEEQRHKPAGADPAKIHVEDVMTPEVLTLRPHDSLIEAARMMRRERIGAVPVLEGGRVVGIITRSDLLAALEQHLAAETPSL